MTVIHNFCHFFQRYFIYYLRVDLAERRRFSDALSKNDMKSPEKMQRRINNLLKVFCCGSISAADAAKGSSSDQPLVLSASVSGSQDTVFEASSKGQNLSERDKNSAWLSRKNWHEKQRGLRHSAVFFRGARFGGFSKRD
jgi:hypothetical protein